MPEQHTPRPQYLGDTAVFGLLVEGVAAQVSRALARFQASEHTIDDMAKLMTETQLAQDRFEAILADPASRDLIVGLDDRLLSSTVRNLERRRASSSPSPSTRPSNSSALAESETELDVATAN